MLKKHTIPIGELQFSTIYFKVMIQV